jgi:3-deoxy-D-manno-octulosonate 8-phosphate phosphatase (KDO 8-P phosphatase)
MTVNDLNARIAAIDLLVLDVDGVLTDGSIMLSPDGAEFKTFHVRDGSAIVWWRRLGKKAAIISGRTSPAVLKRAAELGIDEVRLNVADKRAELDSLMSKLGESADRTCAVGDDLPDLPVMRTVRLAVAVADACPEVRDAAHHVTMAAGGRGAVRETIEWILTQQGRWNEVVDRYK